LVGAIADQVFVLGANVQLWEMEPDTKTFPSGKRCIQGYSGGTQLESYSGLQPEPTL